MTNTFSPANPPTWVEALSVWPYVWAQDTGRYLLTVSLIVICLSLWRFLSSKKK